MKWYIAAVLAFVHNFCKSTVGLENLTRYGTVKQSSRYLHYGAKNTIDGNKNQSWAGESCGHTAAGKSKAWWRLDIEQLATIHRVVIYYRSDRPDRLNGFYIIIGETFSPEKPKEGHECFHDRYDNVMPYVTQDIPCNNVGRFVVIYNERKTSDAFLELCEVEVFGCLLGKYGNTCKNCSTHCQGQICDILTGRCNCSIGYQGPTCDDACTKGTYGMNCAENCNNCKAENCNPIHGGCMNGCKPGWTDSMCRTKCVHGRFGNNCQFECNCANGASCNHVDGSCPQGHCAAGWELNNCSKECSHGRFGKNCQFKCNCLNGASCNHVDGSCPQGHCAAGWDLNNCSKECAHGRFGENCLFKCNCLNGAGCNRVNGSCPQGRCEAGWQLNNCSKECAHGKFGNNCQFKCNCLNGASCNHVDGSCPQGQCAAGWDLNNCSKECAHGKFGNNCQFKCNCLNGASCNHVDGSCPQGQCAAGWDLNNCSKECAYGRFGENCLFKCNCLNGAGCNRVNGSCPQGRCEAGWQLNNCSQECAHGKFGNNCQFICNCLNGVSCNHVDGSCPKGQCAAGWDLNNCSKECEHGRFVENCLFTCNCLNGGGCNHVHGRCPKGLSEAGWQLNNCSKKCAHGRFGERCRFTCNCLNGASCNHVDGSCPQGLCAAGWDLNNCSKACPKGTYGSNCVANCGGCIDDMCDAEFGNCTKYGCKQGFAGHKCDIQDSGRQVEGTAVGAGAGSGLVLLLVIAVFIFFFRKRKENDEDKRRPNCSHSDSSSNIDSEYPLDQCFKNRTCEEREYINVQKRQHCMNANDADKNDFMHQDQEKMYANYSNGCGDEAQYMISINDLAVAVERKKNYKDFDVEFAMLPMGSQYYSHNEAVKEENKQKNRFLTTFAYDHSRVKLVESVTTDYINANYIKSYSNDRAYIATQGPKKSTLNDFWQMIWQENVGKIVMVTALKEGEKIKCEQYWPQSTRASVVTGNWILRMTTERKLTVYTYRCLELTHKLVKEVRQIHHFHFTQWPDHGVPDKTNLVYFHRKVKSTQTDLTGPLVVHCSAGIGRTGTYIALDALYENGQATGFVNVMEFTKMMRKDRMNMIQTVDQYIMVHDALVESFSVEDTTLPADTFTEKFESKQSKIKDGSKNTFYVEYKKLLAIKAKIDPHKFQAGKIKENIAKNFAQTILPHDDFRPFLMSYGRSRNDYINAVIIPSFVQGKNFIATQVPLKETVGDFWSLVYDHDCRTLVVLDGKSLDLSTFPKNDGEESSFDNFIVSTNSHDQSTNKFILKLRHKDYDADIRNVAMYVTDEWSCCTNISNTEKSVIDFIEMIYNDVGRNKSSVVVLCRDGCTRCGVFVALSLAMEQIEIDKEVDIFQIARRIQTRRPQFLTNAEQYEFCYRCIKEYLRSESLYANM